MKKTGDVKTEKEAKTSNVKYITLNIKYIISAVLESNLLKTEQSGELSCLSVLSRPIQHWPQRWTAAIRWKRWKRTTDRSYHALSTFAHTTAACFFHF
jgi:hypothetical protein